MNDSSYCETAPLSSISTFPLSSITSSPSFHIINLISHHIISLISHHIISLYLLVDCLTYAGVFYNQSLYLPL